jgi:malonyl CoA-acyl carrier protein transacylase
MLAFVFPGQGSQKKGMGQGLFDEVEEYAVLEPQVDALLGYSLRQLCLEDVDNKLKETQYTQPCLYVVSALHYYKAIASGPKPDFMAGHSFGEYDALLAAGVFDFLTGLKLVKKRGELMSQAKGGGMAAIIGLPVEKIEAIVKDEKLTTIDFANYNSPTQTVLSGPVDDIKRITPIFEQAGARMVMPLAVSAAFHSRYVADAAKMFADFVAPMTFNAPKIPVVANVTAQLYPAENASDAVKNLLVKQISNSVLWTQSIRFLTSQGVTEFRETGPGNVLTRLIQQIQKP